MKERANCDRGIDNVMAVMRGCGKVERILAGEDMKMCLS